MLRYLEVTEMKQIPAEYAAAAAMKTGMLAEIDGQNGKVKIGNEVATNVYFVNKERVTSGINASRTNFDDYFEDFNTVEEGEMVKLVPLFPGELYGTDQHAFESVKAADSALKNKVVKAVAGKIVASTIPSRLKYEGAMMDGSHVLVKIRVLDTPISNG